MIKNTKPLSMAESLEYLQFGEKEAELKGFIKKFVSITLEKTKEMRNALESLDLMKIKQEHIAKIIDLMPENAEDINKIFSDVGLDEDETKKILETVKQFK